MSNQAGQKIVIIGCGNLAWHLAKQLKALKKFDVHVYNHRPNKNLSLFSKQLKCKTTVGLDKIITDASFYFICVSDKFIGATASQIKPQTLSATVIHTSGSTDIHVLNHKKYNTGVMYPLQTFTLEDEINWKETPLLVEGSSASALKKVKELASKISGKVISANSEERLKMHLAAVVVNNFTNALFVEANAFLKKQNNKLNFNLLLPLINQTTIKLKRMEPLKAQTGPARRGDSKVIKEHLKLLKKQSELKKLYKQFSSLIEKQQK